MQVELSAKEKFDWMELADSKGGKFYHNSLTGTSVKDLPEELKKGLNTPFAFKASPAAHGTPSLQVHFLSFHDLRRFCGACTFIRFFSLINGILLY